MRAALAASSPGAPPAWALAPRRALEQLRGLTETERARGERVSDAGIQRGRDPRGKGGGGEKGLATGGSAPPARPLRTRHCLLKGHSGIQILTRRRREPRGRALGAARQGLPGRTCWRLRLGVGTTYAVLSSAPPRSSSQAGTSCNPRKVTRRRSWVLSKFKDTVRGWMSA